jgi:hypothetical protein
MNAAEIAARYLRETENAGVQWGDERLLCEIGELLGMEMEGHKTTLRVLDRIDRTHKGVFIKRITWHSHRGCGRCRQFWLPECFEKLFPDEKP